MRAAIGDPAFWQVCWAWLMCGSPDRQRERRREARQAGPGGGAGTAKEAGYNGEKIVLMDPPVCPMCMR